MKKRLISLVMIMTMVAALLPLTQAAASDMGTAGQNTVLSIGGHHAALVKSDGSLWTWGHNSYGELGDGTTEDKYTPVKVMDNVASVSLGGYSSAAIKTDGSL